MDDGQNFASTEHCAGGVELAAPVRPSLVSKLVVRNGKEIRYSLLSGSDVVMELYDVAGRRIATLDQGPRGAGDHTVKWEGTAVPAGVYFVRLRANGQVRSAPVVRIGQ